ncbi:MAG TPA: hypothetical protein VH136_18730 [Trebonia sp.]|jgi:hypothetical protein|nr:hypothetical protein [Trebonia sp.]
MLAAYGVDVLDPGTSLRRVHVLLERLPPHARRGGEQWSTEAELMASLIDHVAVLTYVTLKANGANASKPKPVERPPMRRRPQPKARAPRPRRPLGKEQHDGDEQTGSWADAIEAIAGSPGVRVSGDG